MLPQDAVNANDTFDEEPGSARALHRDASTRSFADSDGLGVGFLHPPTKPAPATGRVPYLSKLESVASSAVRAADKVGAALIIVYTQTGTPCIIVSAMKGCDATSPDMMLACMPSNV